MYPSSAVGLTRSSDTGHVTIATKQELTSPVHGPVISCCPDTIISYTQITSTQQPNSRAVTGDTKVTATKQKLTSLTHVPVISCGPDTVIKYKSVTSPQQPNRN